MQAKVEVWKVKLEHLMLLRRSRLCTQHLAKIQRKTLKMYFLIVFSIYDL